MTLEELGLTVEDWLGYLRGYTDERVDKIIDEHFMDIEIPTKNIDNELETNTQRRLGTLRGN